MRTDIQSLLEEITTIETGVEIPDDVIEKDTTYFSFSLTENQIDSDYENNYTNEVNLIGYIKRLVNTEENTLEIVDNARKDIISKLKDFNIRCSYQDVSLTDNLMKIKITGRGKYNEINNTLV